MRISSKLFNQLILHVAEGIQSLREAMIWAVPCVLMFALFTTSVYLLEVFGVKADWASELRSLLFTLFKLLPLVITTSLTYILSVKKTFATYACHHLGLNLYFDCLS